MNALPPHGHMPASQLLFRPVAINRTGLLKNLRNPLTDQYLFLAVAAFPADDFWF